MDPPTGFDESHRDILGTATHVTSWQQSDLDQRRAKVVVAVADYRKEQTILQELERRTEVTTRTLREELSTQYAVIQAHHKDHITALERKAESHAKIAELIADLARKKAEYEARLRVIDEDFDAGVTERNSRFDADTAKQNEMNEQMETAEHHCEVQRKLVAARMRTHEALETDSEQVAHSVDLVNEHYAKQVVAILNRLPPDSWAMGRRDGSGNGTREYHDDVVRMITTMTVNPGPRNKTEHWHSVNKSSHNHVSPLLFKTCVKLKIMDTELSKVGTIRYVLHPDFLDQLDLKPRPRKFQKVQRWHLTRKNAFLATTEARENEYQARKPSSSSSTKRKNKDTP